MRPATKETIPHILLWRTYREHHDSNSQENLINQYSYLVEKMARRLSLSIPQSIIPKEDLISLGYIGLIEAIKKFDYSKGYQFETYGLWRIKGAMLDGVRKIDWVPRGLREKAKKFNHAFHQLEQSLMRTPTEDELCEFSKMTSEEIDQAMAVLSLSTVLSLDEPGNGNQEEGKQQSRLEQLPDENLSLSGNNIQMDEFRKIIATCIDRMPENERLVVSLLYYEGLSQVEVAEVMNLTKGRISQIHSKAILRLRHSFEAKGFSFDSFI